MKPLKTVCVYCGSRVGDDPAFEAAAETLGRAIGERGLRLVYGGAAIGMMGRVAEATLAHGGKVTGVIPHFLSEIELQLQSVDERITTRTMHERKQIMFDKADAFVVLPGGIGTIEETVEMITWRQLNRHKKPIVLVNINGYWSPFLGLLEHVVARSFAGAELQDFYTSVRRAEDVIPAIEAILAGAGAGEIADLQEI